MKIAVLGAGAVGCFYGGMLARAGHDVVLIGRAQHVDAIHRDGLRMEMAMFDGQVPIAASTGVDAVRDAQLVLVCVKSTDTEHAAEQLAPHLATDAIVLSLQNGVDNALRMQRALDRPVGAAVVYVATAMAGPGHVRHHGRGELVIGPSAAAEDLIALFRSAAVPVEVSDNVTGALWAKLILNCAYNALSAITQMPYGQLRPYPGVESLMRDVVAECLAVALKEGVTVPGDPWEAVEAIARTMPGQTSSTAQDLARGKMSEIDHLNGYVVRRGVALGVATPVNHTLHTLVKLLETRS